MRNRLPPGSEAWHELPPTQWSQSELKTITNNTENCALLKKKPLRSVILKRFPLSSIYWRPTKIFQKFWSHLTILGTKRGTRSTPTTQQLPVVNLTVTCHRILVTCELIQILYMVWGGTFNNYAENIRHHFTEFYYLGDQVHRICATLLYDKMWNTSTIHKIWREKTNKMQQLDVYY